MSNDLVPNPFPEVIWDLENLEESVDKIYRYVVIEATKAWKFYFRRRKKDRLLGSLFRLAAKIAVAAAGIIPILGKIWMTTNGDPVIAPEWASIALALAGFCVTMDKFGGFTSGRVRFLVTGQNIYRDLEFFRIDWEKSKLERQGEKLNKDQAIELVARCREFHQHVRNTIAGEIEQWSKEYQDMLSEKAGLPKKTE